MRRKTKKGRLARLKAKLGLPGLEQAKGTVLVSPRSNFSQRRLCFGTLTTRHLNGSAWRSARGVKGQRLRFSVFRSE